ncbi:hypothetical protein ACFX15_007931 [Malus domestica]
MPASLNNEVEERLQYLLQEVKKNSENMKYLTEVVEYVAKHSLTKGVPPPSPARPPTPPKKGANDKNSNGKSEGNGGGANGDGRDLPDRRIFLETSARLGFCLHSDSASPENTTNVAAPFS